MMVPQARDVQNYADSDVESQVKDGLEASKQYERNRKRLSSSEQEDMMKVHFPRVPAGDVAKQLTENEYMELRTSMMREEDKTRSQYIANLHKQLSEYHSILDELSLVTFKYEALQKSYQEQVAERNSRIHSLEQEVAALKRDVHQQHQQPNYDAYHVENNMTFPRRVSVIHPFCNGGLTYQPQMPSFPLFVHQPHQPPVQMQQMRQTSTSSLIQLPNTSPSSLQQPTTASTGSSFYNNSIDSRMYELPPGQQQQASSTTLHYEDMTEPAGRYVSAFSPRSTAGTYNQQLCDVVDHLHTVYFPSADVIDMKRKISSASDLEEYKRFRRDD